MRDHHHEQRGSRGLRHPPRAGGADGQRRLQHRAPTPPGRHVDHRRDPDADRFTRWHPSLPGRDHHRCRHDDLGPRRGPGPRRRTDPPRAEPVGHHGQLAGRAARRHPQPRPRAGRADPDRRRRRPPHPVPLQAAASRRLSGRADQRPHQDPLPATGRRRPRGPSVHGAGAWRRRPRAGAGYVPPDRGVRPQPVEVHRHPAGAEPVRVRPRGRGRHHQPSGHPQRARDRQRGEERLGPGRRGRHRERERERERDGQRWAAAGRRVGYPVDTGVARGRTAR